MSAIDQRSSDQKHYWDLWHGDDYSILVRHLQQEDAERSSLASLTATAGLKSATEAYFLFLELQAGLGCIRILGHNADELQGRLDWCSLVMGMWVERMSIGPAMNEWMSIMESWQFIIENTASMAICFALRPGDTQGMALDEGGSDTISSRVLSSASDYMVNHDRKLVRSVVKAARSREWNLPLEHDRPFHKMIAHLRSSIHKDHPRRMLRQQRRRGIEASHFERFVTDIEKEAQALLGFLSSEERENLEHGFVRLIKATLASRVNMCNLRYLRICQKVLSQWLSSDHTLRSGAEEEFQEQVQEAFYKIATRRSYWFLGHEPELPIDKDLSEVLALGADVNGNLHHRTGSILYDIASSNCPIDSFRALVAAGALYSPRNNSEHDGASPLHAAAGANNTDVIAFLLDRGLHSFEIDINARDRRNYQTPLHYAARHSDVEAIDMLLQQPGIDIDARDHQGLTPFLLAASEGAIVAMSRLLRTKKVDCHRLTVWGGENALHLAANCPKSNSLSYVLRHVRNVNDKGRAGNTPLHRAVAINSSPNISILLKHGADPSITDEYGFTPFAFACEGRYLGPMKLLLRASHGRVEPFAKPVGSPCIFSDDDSHLHFSPVTLILHNVRTAGKRTMAHARLALKIVLAAKPDLEVRDSKGRSVLSKVIETIDSGMIQALLHAGSDVNSRDNEGKSILHKAIRAIDGVALKILLRAGADVDSQDNEGNTPMHEMLGGGISNLEMPKMLKMLLEFGANPEIKNRAGEDPVTANRKLHGEETWQVDAAFIIREHKMKIANARKALAKAKKQENKRLPSPKRPWPSNPFSALTLEGED